MNTSRLDDDTVRRLASEIAVQTGAKRPLWRQVTRAALFAAGLIAIALAFVVARSLMYQPLI